MLDNKYPDQCHNCGSNIYRDYETDQQIGRCLECGSHEKDQDCRNDPHKPLDFND